MKQLRFLAFLLAVSAVLMIQSCEDEEDIKPAPTVVLDVESNQNIPGATVTVTATVSAPNGGKTLTVFVGGVEAESYDLGGAAETEQAFSYTIPQTAVVGSSIIITFQATDNRDFSSAVANHILTVGDPVIVLTGTLPTQTLSAGVPYLIRGQAIVPTGNVLTVQAGAIIKGEKSTKGVLIIQPGGRLVANGTASNPIVFTSNQGPGERDRGDWGGIVWLGNAFVNQANRPAVEGITPQQLYGTVGAANIEAGATEDNGSLRFARIEYAGIELTPNNETNSLTMGGLGAATVVENVQVSYGGDDGFEWFGGKVNAKRLISLSTWDDDFDTDLGWTGNVQWGIVVRNPFFADQSGSNSFESDNQNNADPTVGCTDTEKAGCTGGVFSNISVFGPRDFGSRAISANYQNAIHIRRRTNISIFNSFFSGFRIGLRVDDAATIANLTSGSAVHQYNVLSIPGNFGTGTSSTAADGLFLTNTSSGDASAIATYWNGNNNQTVNNITAITPLTDLGVSADFYFGSRAAAAFPSNPAFTLAAGNAALAGNLNGTANFSNAKLGAFFDKTITYRGAFGATDWTDGWSEFQPISKIY